MNLNPSSIRAEQKISIYPEQLTQPLIIQGSTRGIIAAQEIVQTKNTVTGVCNGYVNAQPNYLLDLQAFFPYLKLEVNSQADTTIIIKNSEGVWCNDDSATTNPLIAGQWQAGLYQVWIGSYYQNSDINYQIKLTKN
ncbi:MAG: hypothetical protein AAFQ80_01120 [Cyanobacteria bacterium J06621_8]